MAENKHVWAFPRGDGSYWVCQPADMERAEVVADYNSVVRMVGEGGEVSEIPGKWPEKPTRDALFDAACEDVPSLTRVAENDLRVRLDDAAKTHGWHVAKRFSPWQEGDVLPYHVTIYRRVPSTGAFVPIGDERGDTENEAIRMALEKAETWVAENEEEAER